MSEQRKKILEMLAAGTINAEEAERLLVAIENNASQTKEDFLNLKDLKDLKNLKDLKKIKSPKFLHVKVEKEAGINCKHENVDIKIPIMLLKAGMKLGSMIPEGSKSQLNSHLSDKGIHLDLNNIDSKDLDVIMVALSESSIDIDTDKEKVRIFCA